MPEEMRSKINGKPPITRHPLFPATVALWFGALFGLGSLAIRPGLLESLFTSLHVDAVFAAAAPPLGATARILVALALAGIGGYIGAVLARRIARPKPVTRERKRGANEVGSAHKQTKSAPFSAELSELDDESDFTLQTNEQTDKKASANRRRQLTMADDTYRADFHETAPLPGANAKNPTKILDVSDFGLEGFEVEDNTPASDKFAVSERYDANEGHSDGFAAEPLPEDAQIFKPAPPAKTISAQSTSGYSEEVSPQSSAPAPFAAPDETPDNALSSTLFASYTKDVGSPEQERQSPPNIESDSFSGPAVPENTAERTDPFTPLARLGSDPDAIEADTAEKSTSSIFDPPMASPLFERPAHSEDGDDSAGESPPAAEMPSTSSGEFEPFRTVLDPEAKASAAERIAAADLGELSHVELLERLAISLARRRDQAAAEIASHLSNSNDEANLAAIDPDTQETADPSENVIAAPPPASIPAALRPIGLDDGDDDGLLPSFIPPRHIGRNRAETQGETTGESAVVELDIPAQQVGTAGTDAKAGAGPLSLEEGYSSLLDLSHAQPERQQFVRINEPETLEQEIEPVVIFPGQESRRDVPFAKPDTPVSESQPAAAAPFSPPHGMSDAPQQAPLAAAPSRQDPEETERALRTALATLQRMSAAS